MKINVTHHMGCSIVEPRSIVTRGDDGGRRLTSLLSTSITRSERMLPAASIESASRLCFSITLRYLG